MLAVTRGSEIKGSPKKIERDCSPFWVIKRVAKVGRNYSVEIHESLGILVVLWQKAHDDPPLLSYIWTDKKVFTVLFKTYGRGTISINISKLKVKGLNLGGASPWNFIEYPHPRNSKNSPGAQKLADIQGISRVVWGLYTKRLLIAQMSQ